jgi:hypothetical protein
MERRRRSIARGITLGHKLSSDLREHSRGCRPRGDGAAAARRAGALHYIVVVHMPAVPRFGTCNRIGVCSYIDLYPASERCLDGGVGLSVGCSKRAPVASRSVSATIE